MKDAHNKAAEHHENAAKSHRAPPSLMARMTMGRARTTQSRPSSTRRMRTRIPRRRTTKAPSKANVFHREAEVGFPVGSLHERWLYKRGHAIVCVCHRKLPSASSSSAVFFSRSYLERGWSYLFSNG